MNSRDRLIELIQSAVGGCARHWAEKISDYLIANGVIVPQCKVGDTVYQVDSDRIYKSTVKIIIYDTDGIAFDERAIGESVFLTREEAEKALERSKDNA